MHLARSLLLTDNRIGLRPSATVVTRAASLTLFPEGPTRSFFQREGVSEIPLSISESIQRILMGQTQFDSSHHELYFGPQKNTKNEIGHMGEKYQILRPFLERT